MVRVAGVEPTASWTPFKRATKLRHTRMELMEGFEPTTYWLQINCSASWATSAFFKILAQNLNFVNQNSAIFKNFILTHNSTHHS